MVTRLLDPFRQPASEALARPWRTLAELAALVLIVAAWVALLVLYGGAS